MSQQDGTGDYVRLRTGYLPCHRSGDIRRAECDLLANSNIERVSSIGRGRSRYSRVDAFLSVAMLAAVVHFGPTILHNGQTFLVRTTAWCGKLCRSFGQNDLRVVGCLRGFLSAASDAISMPMVWYLTGLEPKRAPNQKCAFFRGRVRCGNRGLRRTCQRNYSSMMDVPSDFTVLPGHIEEEPLSAAFAQGRRRVLRHRQLGNLCADQCRSARH